MRKTQDSELAKKDVGARHVLRKTRDSASANTDAYNRCISEYSKTVDEFNRGISAEIDACIDKYGKTHDCDKYRDVDKFNSCIDEYNRYTDLYNKCIENAN